MKFSLLSILFFVSLFVEYYIYQGIKVLTHNRKKQKIWISLSVFILLIIIIWAFIINRNNQTQVHILLGMVLLIYIPKLVLVSVLLLEDMFRFFAFVFKKSVKSSQAVYYPGRRKTITTIGLGLASIPFLSIIEGMVWGKFDFRIRKTTLTFPDLPDNFDGYKIVQISDIHLGSFDLKDKDKIEKGLRMINSANADLFVFTGDSVNNYAEEMAPWSHLLKQIKAKDGKYSILGNHDYGIYVFGEEDVISQQKNIKKLDKYHQEIDWKLLRNESVVIDKGEQHINLIGVENWGSGHFPRTGDLVKASKDVENGEFNILLSHDPTHFDAVVKNFSKKIQLTLSGHTHGMQFGVEIPGLIKWSPAKYKYPKWAGLYQEKEEYLYVNRGFGYIGFSGRVGIWPEITIIELKKS